jgi:hypothetical protein
MPKLVAFQAHSDGVLFLFCFPFYNLFLVVIRYELSPFPKKAGGSFNFPPHISVSSWGGVKLDTNACTNKKVLRYQYLRPKKKTSYQIKPGQFPSLIGPLSFITPASVISSGVKSPFLCHSSASEAVPEHLDIHWACQSGV